MQVREAQAHIREVERGAGKVEGQGHVGPFQAAHAPRQRQRGGCLSGRLGRRGGRPWGLVGEAQPDAPQRHPQVAFHLDRAGAAPTFTHIRNKRGRGRGMHEIEGLLHVHFGAAAHLGMARAGRGMHGHALKRGAGRGANKVGGQDGRALHAQMAVQALRHRPSGMIGKDAIDHIARQLQPAHRQSRQSARMAVVEDRRIVEPASHQAGVEPRLQAAGQFARHVALGVVHRRGIHRRGHREPTLQGILGPGQREGGGGVRGAEARLQVPAQA